MVSDTALQYQLPELFGDFNKAAQPNPAPGLQTHFNTMAFRDTPENLKNYDLNNDGEFSPADFVSPKTPEFIEKPSDLFDEELISREFDMPVMILDTEFGEKAFGTKDNPNTELREIATDLAKGNEVSDTAKEQLANSFEEALRAEYPQHAEVFDTVQDSYFFNQAATSFQILKMAEGEPIPGAGSFAAMSHRMLNENDETVGNTITVNNQDDIDWATTNATATQYAGQDIDYPYPIEYRMYEILGEEIEHAHQFKNEYDSYFDYVSPETYTEHYNNTTHITEIGGKMGGMEVAKKLVEQQEGPQAAEKYAEFSSNLDQATTFHITLRQAASKGADDVESIRGYAYSRNLERYDETGELLDPGQLAETRVALAEKVLEPYGLDSDIKQQAFKDFAEQHSYPTFQHVKARLQEIVNDETTSPQMQEMAASELDALDTIGIDRVNVGAHAAQWQQFWQSHSYEYFADQPIVNKMPNTLGVVTGYEEGVNSSKDWAEKAAESLSDMINKAAENGVLKQFREDMVGRAPKADIMGQDDSKLSKQDYRETFDKIGRETLGEKSYNKTINQEHDQQSSTQPKAEADIMPG